MTKINAPILVLRVCSHVRLNGGLARDTPIFAWEGHEMGLALPGVVPLATAKAITSFTQPAERPRMSTVGRWCGGRTPTTVDCEPQFAACHVLTRTKFANCARLRSFISSCSTDSIPSALFRNLPCFPPSCYSGCGFFLGRMLLNSACPRALYHPRAVFLFLIPAIDNLI